MKFSDLSVFFAKLEKTPSRNEITVILSDLFKKADPGEIDKITYLALGKLGPSYNEEVLNLAERMMFRVFEKAYKKDLGEMKKQFKSAGDLGIVAERLSTEAKTKGNLKVVDVYEQLVKISRDGGEGSQERKVEKMSLLLTGLDPLSARYVSRIPVGKLRLGFSDKTVLDALSWFVVGDKSASGQIENAYRVLPDVGLLALEIKKYGLERATKNVKPKLGVPVMSMLCQRLKSPREMIKKMGGEAVAVEPKLDGLRIQIHFKRGPGGFVKAYTRNLNEVSWMFPELSLAGKYIGADEVILDGEAMGVDEERKTLANFQSTMTRRRKYDIEKISEKIGIKFYVFDILYKDGKGLMDKPYFERKDNYLPTVKNGSLFVVVNYELTDDPDAVSKIHARFIEEGFEGVIVKKYDSKYVPGRTGWRWIKMKEKEESTGKLTDTIDCIVMGYSSGRGKRANFGIGQFLVGIRDGENYKTISKVGTGLTDEQFKDLKRRLQGLEVEAKPKEYIVNNLLNPDYWVFPELVVEIAADNITQSPSHTAGLALRFPRLVRFRNDKKPQDATSLNELKKIFKLQKD
jgi:DNA ligase-1